MVGVQHPQQFMPGPQQVMVGNGAPAGMAGVWEPTRTAGWQKCPVPEHDRRLYQMTIGGDGHWKGGRAGSYIEADNFHGWG